MSSPKPPAGPRAVWPTITGPISEQPDSPRDKIVDDPEELAALSDPFRELRGGRRSSLPEDPDPSKDPDFKPTTLINDRYRVERLIGEGGMAKVYRAIHTTLDEPVALKVLIPSLAKDPDVVARFLREARLMASFRNPHIVRVHDAAEAVPGRPYFVMELLKGKSLDVEMGDRGLFPIGRAVRMISDVCDALIDVHDAGLVHRDIKPENLFIEDRRGRPHVKLLDFGVTKVTERGSRASLSPDGVDVKATQGLVGTPHYMSPEQVQTSSSIDARSDIWAVGVVLYELLVGETPFEAQHLIDIMQRILTAHPTPPSVHQPRLPRELDEVILRCLEKDPKKRYASARELKEALAPFLVTFRTPAADRISLPAVARASAPSISELDRTGPTGPRSERSSDLEAQERYDRSMRETRPTGERGPGGATKSGPRVASAQTLGPSPSKPPSTSKPGTVPPPSSTFPMDVSPGSSLAPTPSVSPRRSKAPLFVIAGVIAVAAIAVYALLQGSGGSSSRPTAPASPGTARDDVSGVPAPTTQPSAPPTATAGVLPSGARKPPMPSASPGARTTTAEARPASSSSGAATPRLDPSDVQ